VDCIRLLLGAGALAVGITLASAQSYPTKPIRFIAPFPPAGSSDLIIRILSQLAEFVHLELAQYGRIVKELGIAAQ
jgi:tripartite-type tricarboxylate transporter receptor subunit TctC